MNREKLVDTFPDFLIFWEKARNLPLAIQLELWESEYMAGYPELREKQIQNYADQQEDWKQIASEKVFPFLGERLSAMQEARDNILSSFSNICNLAHTGLDFEDDPTGVIYVGLGCGAGWVTTYHERPAILFGLENAAECGWAGSNSIRGLTAHELGHVIHEQWRRKAGMEDGEGAWWDLYTEGFAQRCEHLILGEETWHEATGLKTDWVAWCRKKQVYLAGEFLRYLAEGMEVWPFFGSWYDIDGYSQSGYFLGHQAIRALEESGMSMKEIGVIDDPEIRLRGILEEFAQEKR